MDCRENICRNPTYEATASSVHQFIHSGHKELTLEDYCARIVSNALKMQYSNLAPPPQLLDSLPGLYLVLSPQMRLENVPMSS